MADQATQTTSAATSDQTQSYDSVKSASSTTRRTHPTGEVDDRKAYVGAYPNTANYPLEIGEVVYVVKPGFRAPLGPFIVSAAYASDIFALNWQSTNLAYDELVEGKFIKRDPYSTN